MPPQRAWSWLVVSWLWSGLGCLAIPDAGVDPAPAADAALPAYLAGCESLFAARVTERQRELDPTFPAECGAALRDPIGLLDGAPSALCTAGESANACRDRLYASPPDIATALDPGCPAGATGCLRGAWLAPCADGSSTSCAAPEAVCQDGTRPMVYTERATEGGPSDDWIFFLGGEGGPCYGPTCWFDYRYAHVVEDGVFERAMSSLHPDYLTKSTAAGDGITSGQPGTASAHYNRVRFNRCSDAASDAVETVAFGDGVPQEILDRYPGAPLPLQSRTSTAPVWHRGFRVWSSAFGTLRDGLAGLPALSRARTVVLAGSSDAAAWLTYAADRLAEQLRTVAPNATVKVIIDAFYEPGLDGEGRFVAQPPAGFDSFTKPYSVTHACALPDNGNGVADESCSDAGYLPGSATSVPLSHHDALAARGTLLDASCEARHGAGAAECYDKIHTLMHHVGTPFLVVADQEDSSISQAAIAYADASTYRWLRPEDYRVRVLAQSRDADALWATAAREDGPGQRGDAMFVLRKARRGAQPWQAAEHTHLGSSAKLREPMTRCTAIGSAQARVPLSAMIESWLRGSARDPFVVEDGLTWNGVDPYWVTGDSCIAPE